jgi:hypothetical protein
MITDNESIHTPRYRGVSRTTVISAAKEAVTVAELAGRLTALKPTSNGWVGRCPLPGHEDTNPSFAVYSQNNRWYCFACLQGGDVVDLARHAWGYDERDVGVAAGELLHTFGHPIPPRPSSWRRKQQRQRPVRDAIEQARFEHVRRRLFRCFFKPHVLAIEDEAEREAEYRILWDATKPLAKMMLADLEERRTA